MGRISLISLALLTLPIGSVRADGPVDVRVKIAPLKFHESTTTTEKSKTIIGPGGERTERGNERVDTSEMPLSKSVHTTGDAEVQGVSNPGITFERRIYVPGRENPIVTTPDAKVETAPGGAIIVGPEVQGGPGSVHTESTQKTTTTPRVDVQVRTR